MDLLFPIALYSNESRWQPSWSIRRLQSDFNRLQIDKSDPIERLLKERFQDNFSCNCSRNSKSTRYLGICRLEWPKTHKNPMLIIQHWQPRQICQIPKRCRKLRRDKQMQKVQNDPFCRLLCGYYTDHNSSTIQGNLICIFLFWQK